LSLKGEGGPVALLVSDTQALSFAGGEANLGEGLLLHASDATFEARDGKTYLKLGPGQTATFTYRWK
jgi:hypothetical protein